MRTKLLRYTKEDKLLKTYLEFQFGKQAARVWIRYPKYELFKLLASFSTDKGLKNIRDAVKNDEDYFMRAAYGIKIPFH